MKNTNIFDYVIISQTPLPLVIKRNHLETPSPLGDYVICERPLTRKDVEEVVSAYHTSTLSDMA